MVRWAATHRLARGPYATIVNSAGDRHRTGGIGAQDGGGVGTGVGMANLSDPQNHTSVHHTHLMMWGHRAAPLGTRYGRAALCAWVPRQRLWGCGSRAKVQARATVTSSGSVAAFELQPDWNPLGFPEPSIPRYKTTKQEKQSRSFHMRIEPCSILLPRRWLFRCVSVGSVSLTIRTTSPRQ